MDSPLHPSRRPLQLQSQNSITENPMIAEEKEEDDQIDSRSKRPNNSFSGDHYKTNEGTGMRKRPMESNRNSNVFSKPNMFNTSKGK